MSNGRIITCADCGETKRHHGRGLCATCWNAHSRAGTLTNFERSRLKFRDNPENREVLTGGSWVKSRTNPWLRVWREDVVA